MGSRHFQRRANAAARMKKNMPSFIGVSTNEPKNKSPDIDQLHEHLVNSLDKRADKTEQNLMLSSEDLCSKDKLTTS